MQLILPLTESGLVAGSGDVRQIDVRVVRSARRRSLAVHVSALGAVEARVPLRAEARDIEVFLRRHREWILRKVADASRSPPWTPLWAEGGHWYWRGEAVGLATGGGRGGELVLSNLHLPVNPVAPGDEWRRQVFSWHRRAAAPLLEARARALFGQHCGGHRLQAITLRWMRSTWATCGGCRAADGARDIRLRLNPWLAALPDHLCDAVLLHELAHVEHMNHGAAFYRRLATLNPAWREQDEELGTWSRRLFPVAAR